MPAEQPSNHALGLLGEHQQTFLPRVQPGRILLGTAIGCALLAVVEFITALTTSQQPTSAVLSDKFRTDAIMVALILGVVFVSLAGLIAALYYTHIKHRVDVFTGGLVITTWRGSTTFLWDEIDLLQREPIFGRSSRTVNWRFTIYGEGGKKGVYLGLDGLQTLAQLIERKAPNLLN